MIIETVSVIPQVFESYLNASIMGRAKDKRLFSFTAHDLRTWTHDKHKTVDDAPFGGGQGMLMKPAPIFEAVRELTERAHLVNTEPHIVFFSPCGRPYKQSDAIRLSKHEHLIFVCGRYEGMDERVYTLADEVISLGDYVLTGGELGALVVIDSVVRLLPGALGDEMSAQDESFTEGLLEYAQYTRPAVFEGMSVPEVLLSGDHGAIATWRHNNSLERTSMWRPDLLNKRVLSPSDMSMLEDIEKGSE